jgi:cytochrome c553
MPSTLTKADTRGETCEFCHGIGGAASTTVVLDPEGHGLPEGTQGIVTAPGDTNQPYRKNAQLWGCLECHSPHDNQTVKLAGFSSNKLLKANPNPGKNYLYYTPVIGETAQTLSQWCSTCHNANFGASSEGKTVLMGSETATTFGHPSSGAGTVKTPDGHTKVTLDDGVNNGPTCKECHIADGRTETSEFPHSSGSAPSMLKDGSDGVQIDNVCTECHNTVSLP